MSTRPNTPTLSPFIDLAIWHAPHLLHNIHLHMEQSPELNCPEVTQKGSKGLHNGSMHTKKNDSSPRFARSPPSPQTLDRPTEQVDSDYTTKDVTLKTSPVDVLLLMQPSGRLVAALQRAGTNSKLSGVISRLCLEVSPHDILHGIHQHVLWLF